MSALTELWRLLLQWPLLPPLLLMVRIAMAVELLSTHLQRYPALLDPTQKQEKTNMISQRSPDGQEAEMRKELRILGADPKANEWATQQQRQKSSQSTGGRFVDLLPHHKRIRRRRQTHSDQSVHPHGHNTKSMI